MAWLWWEIKSIEHVLSRNLVPDWQNVTFSVKYIIESDEIEVSHAPAKTLPKDILVMPAPTGYAGLSLLSIAIHQHITLYNDVV